MNTDFKARCHAGDPTLIIHDEIGLNDPIRHPDRWLPALRPEQPSLLRAAQEVQHV